jgi:hypothetical protein
MKTKNVHQYLVMTSVMHIPLFAYQTEGNGTTLAESVRCLALEKRTSVIIASLDSCFYNGKGVSIYMDRMTCPRVAVRCETASLELRFRTTYRSWTAAFLSTWFQETQRQAQALAGWTLRAT